MAADESHHIRLDRRKHFRTSSFEVRRLIDKKIKAAIFDFWQTLIDTSTVDSTAVWNAYTGASKELVYMAMNRHEDDFMSGRISLPDWPYLVADTLGIKISEQTAKKITAEIQELWIKESEPYADARELLLDLRSAGIKTAVCSNANPFTRAVIDFYFSDVLDARIVSCEVGHIKPNPEIFQATIRELRVRPDEVAYAGDGGHNEISGAKTFGFSTILVRSERGWVKNNPQDDPGEAADERVDLLSQISALLIPGRA